MEKHDGQPWPIMNDNMGQEQHLYAVTGRFFRLLHLTIPAVSVRCRLGGVRVLGVSENGGIWWDTHNTGILNIMGFRGSNCFNGGNTVLRGQMIKPCHFSWEPIQRVSATSQDFLLVGRQIAGFDKQNLMGKDHRLTVVLEAGIA